MFHNFEFPLSSLVEIGQWFIEDVENMKSSRTADRQTTDEMRSEKLK